VNAQLFASLLVFVLIVMWLGNHQQGSMLVLLFIFLVPCWLLVIANTALASP
jgi:hypothetical protein